MPTLSVNRAILLLSSADLSNNTVWEHSANLCFMADVSNEGFRIS